MIEDIEICAKIKSMAARLMPPSEMAARLNINEDDLKSGLKKHNSPVRKAFLCGVSETVDEIRETNISVAKTGSPDAIRNCLSAMREMINDIDE